MANDLPKRKPIISVDFDGVLHSYESGWKGPRNIPDPPVPGALEWLAYILREDVFEVHIFSSRSRYFGGRLAMRKWLNREACNMKEYTYLRPDILFNKLKFPLRKPPALLAIDDRCMCFEGTFPTIDQIKRFKPWNKR